MKLAQDYVGRRSRLAYAITRAIEKGQISPDAKLITGSGQIGGPRSNLGKTLSKYQATTYIVGGRAGYAATAGHHWAVVVPQQQN